MRASKALRPTVQCTGCRRVNGTSTVSVMATSTLGPRLAAACGSLYPVLLLVGDDVIAGGDAVAPDAGSPEEVLANLVTKNEPVFFFGRSVGLLSLMCLLVFSAYVATRLRHLRGQDSIAPYVALGAGAMAAALTAGSAVFQLSLVEREGAGTSPDLAVTLLEMGRGFDIAFVPLGIFLAAVAVEGVQGTMLARWLGWSAAVLAVGLVVGYVAGESTGTPAVFFVIMLVWLWFIPAGISMARRAGRLPEVAAADAPAHP
jgi:hypothetical protein